ncbi:hypothetical protein [Chondromyces apiculatus]|uniref:Uncharacterized protein n=1 Tax=Chondromyces apiculatus DSM 436 TaxID=1192034 RepID=A0A017T2L0_9BACT|nr:hypothetical protein [Chondromyces apiculatus]EYF03473.1 Hypothetical protein CAP_5457 [Chondromyces apiculatus DSM 436]
MPLPPGTEILAHWAASRRLSFTAHPDEAWFRQWEPYATITPPSAYYNACTWTASGSRHLCIAEPWYAPEGEAPLERTLLGFAVHPGITRRAAARLGEHFLTRVVFLEGPPPIPVTLGDPAWDAGAATFASSPEVAAGAFHPRLRRLLHDRGFQGHIELRARGGLVVHLAGVQPNPGGYELLLGVLREITDAAVAG